MAQDTREAAGIEQQILALPDNEYLGIYYSENNSPYCLDGNSLKALVRQRDELLEAAKRFLEKGVWQNAALNYADVVDDDELARLRSAVEGAEG